MSTRKVIIYKGKLYFSDVTVPTRVSQLANDAGYVTTDEKVKQTPTTSGGPYRILLSNDTDDTEHIEKVRKSSSLIYYPSGVMELTGTILGTETCKTTIQSYNIRINVTDDQNVSKYMDIWNDDISLSGNTWDGTNASLKTAIGSLISGLSPYSLLQYTGISSTETSYNTITVSGIQRKFSDYRYILFIIQYNQNDYRDTYLINSSFWTTGASIVRNILHGAGGSTGANYNVSGVTFKYNSDTSLKAVTHGAGTFQYIQVLGICKF